MADHESEYFIPDKVDEQIDSFLAGEYTVQRSDLLDMQVVQSLQRHYAPVGDESQPLERVWNRLTLHRASLQPSQDEAASQNRLQLDSAAQPEGSHRMKITVRNPLPQYTPLRRLSLIAAIVFITLLVGSTFAVFHLTRQGQGSGNGHATPTIHPTVQTDEIYAIVNNTIYRYDATTHRPLWSFKMPVPGNAENIGSRAQVVGSVLYTLGTGSDGYYSYAINTADGSLRWRFKVTYQTFDLSLLGDQLIANGIVYLSEASPTGGIA